MKVFAKLRTLLVRQPAVAPAAPIYPDAEFLEYVAEQGRRRFRAEQEAAERAASARPPQQAA